MNIEDKAIQILNKKIEQIKPEYIKKNETILGIEGTYEGLDTSDGTLQSQNMVEGSIGYSNYEKVVGTMPNFPVNNILLDNVTDLVNSGRVRIQENMNNLITDQKAYVKRTDQLNIYVNHNILREALNISPEIVKLDEDILDITGTFISPMDETLDYDRCLEKTDAILGENSLYLWLEYIQSTGTQWIDTEYLPLYNSKYEIQFEFINNVMEGENVFDALFGTRNVFPPIPENENNCNNILLGFYENGCFSYAKTEQTNLELTTPNTLYTVKIVANKLYVKNNETGDFELKSKLDRYEFEADLPLYLFCENHNGSAYGQCAVKLHYFKIYDKLGTEYVLARHFIPVINKTTNEVCLFDRVSKTFFNNLGTDTFIAGPEKSSEDIVSDYSDCIDLAQDILGN